MKKLLILKKTQQNILDTETARLATLTSQRLAQHDAIDRGFGGDDLSDVIKATSSEITKCNDRLINAWDMLESVNAELLEHYKNDPDRVIAETEKFKASNE